MPKRINRTKFNTVHIVVLKLTGNESYKFPTFLPVLKPLHGGVCLDDNISNIAITSLYCEGEM